MTPASCMKDHPVCCVWKRFTGWHILPNCAVRPPCHAREPPPAEASSCTVQYIVVQPALSYYSMCPGGFSSLAVRLNFRVYAHYIISVIIWCFSLFKIVIFGSLWHAFLYVTKMCNYVWLKAWSAFHVVFLSTFNSKNLYWIGIGKWRLVSTTTNRL